MTSETTTWPELVVLVPGHARAVLDRSWWSWAGPHGGLLGALLLRTAQQLSGDRELRAISVHYLSAPPEGPVELSAALLREGGSSAVVRADLRAPAGTLAATAVVTSGRAAPRRTASYNDVAPPPAPPPGRCEPLEIPPAFVPFAGRFLYRLVGPAPLSGGDHAELVAWVRLRTDEPYDAAALVVLTDVLPPALYGAAAVPLPVPTVELHVVLAGGAPVRGWVLTRIATRTAGDGWCVDDSEVWTPDGQLLAQARQVRRVLGELT